MRLAKIVVWALLLGVLSTSCGDDDGGEADVDGAVNAASCTVSQTATAVTVTCGSSVSVIPISGRLPDGGIVGCAVERRGSGVSIECSDGSRVTFPTAPGIDGGLVMCSVTDGANGAISINCPDGTGAVIPGTETASSLTLVGPTTASCGTCHDSPAARAHFSVMTVIPPDAGPIETCETCHAEGSIMPVTRAHARLEYLPPGLKVTLSEPSIDPVTRKPKVRIRLSTLDDAGMTPLDRAGISMSITISKAMPINLSATNAPAVGPYVSYLNRTVTQQNTPSFPIPEGTPPRMVVQPTAENTTSGKFAERTVGVVGDYDYTFAAALPMDYDPSATHIMAIYATRTVASNTNASVRYVGNADVAFVPNSPATVPPVHDIVRTATCNGCHNPLGAHGGSRQSVPLCLTCHTQGAVDPESNNSIDFNVMIHKIHMGNRLPEVAAGKPYIIIGNSLSVHDWSHAGFPQPIENCQSCHTANDSDRWVTNGSRAVCLSCHSDVGQPNPPTTVHPFDVSSPDNVCGKSCHTNTTPGKDAREAHLVPLNNPMAAVFSAEILSVTVMGPDSAPAVRFRALTGTRMNVAPDGGLAPMTPVTDPAKFSWLEAQINGPNTGFVLNAYNLIRVPKDQLMNLTADTAAPGEFTFTLPKTLRQLVGTVGDPESDSYTLSLRAQYDPTPGAMPDNDKVDSLRNSQKEFGGGEVVAVRKPIADTQKCNSCHGDLTMHGTYALAKNTEQCALCHTSTFDTRVRQGANKAAGPTTSLRLSTLVHRIHGASIAERPYKVYGYAPMPPYPVVDFSEIGFPGDARDCTKCHFTTPAPTYTVPVPEGEPPSQLVVLDADGGVVGGQ